VAVTGVGVFETLREISKLTVPVVREKLFGEKPRTDHDTGRIAEHGPDEVPGPGPEAKRVPSGQTTRVVVKSRKEIEDELDKLSKEYTGK
jgi:hypothetical protein